MKKKGLLIITLLIVFTISAEDFYVLHVKGRIITNGGSLLKLGDKLTDKDQVQFLDKSAIAVVMSTTRGRLHLENKIESSATEFSYLVNNIINPSQGKLSTRDVQEILTVKDLKNHIKGKYYPIVESRKISLPNQLPITEGNHYYFSYKYNGQTIKRIIKTENNEMLINEKIYQINDELIDSEQATDKKLYYYSADYDRDMLVSDFSPIFLKKEKLIKELEVFLSVQTKLGQLSDNPIIDLTNFIHEIYGNFDEEELKHLYNTELKK